MCWSKHEPDQWERERIERQVEGLRLICSTQPNANESEPELETAERDAKLVRS